MNSRPAISRLVMPSLTRLAISRSRVLRAEPSWRLIVLRPPRCRTPLSPDRLIPGPPGHCIDRLLASGWIEGAGRARIHRIRCLRVRSVMRLSVALFEPALHLRRRDHRIAALTHSPGGGCEVVVAEAARPGYLERPGHPAALVELDPAARTARAGTPVGRVGEVRDPAPAGRIAVDVAGDRVADGQRVELPSCPVRMMVGGDAAVGIGEHVEQRPARGMAPVVALGHPVDEHLRQGLSVARAFSVDTAGIPLAGCVQLLIEQYQRPVVGIPSGAAPHTPAASARWGELAPGPAAAPAGPAEGEQRRIPAPEGGEVTADLRLESVDPRRQVSIGQIGPVDDHYVLATHDMPPLSPQPESTEAFLRRAFGREDPADLGSTYGGATHHSSWPVLRISGRVRVSGLVRRIRASTDVPGTGGGVGSPHRARCRAPHPPEHAGRVSRTSSTMSQSAESRPAPLR